MKFKTRDPIKRAEEMAAEMRKSSKRELVSSKRTRSLSLMVGSFQVRGAGVLKICSTTRRKYEENSREKHR